MTYCALDRNGLGLRPGAYAGCVASSLFRLHAVLFFSSSCFNVFFLFSRQLFCHVSPLFTPRLDT